MPKKNSKLTLEINNAEVKTGCVPHALQDKAKTLPKLPGCYLMKNRSGDILYIGKAKNLQARVRSYFNNSAAPRKVEVLVSKVADFDFLVTDSDAEAFVLENNLIKKHRPKYNIRLKDDKSYPYAEINKNEIFPRIRFSRRPVKKKGIKVFGPFAQGSNIFQIIRIVTKSFGLRDCSLREFNKREQPCLLYQLAQCSAPCVGKIEADSYNDDLEVALSIFSGKGKKAISFLAEKMERAASEEKFELAALLRDNISVLSSFVQITHQENAEFFGGADNIDAISFYEGEAEIDICIYIVRSGMILSHKNFQFLKADSLEEIQDEVLLKVFDYYCDSISEIPQKVILPLPSEKLESFGSALNEICEKNVVVTKPIGKYTGLVNLAQKNASETQRVRIEGQSSPFIGLRKLMDLLSLSERPRRLECVDVAIFQGDSPTASQIVFVDGVAQKSDYRYYHLKTLPEGNNDFAMMREFALRRFNPSKKPFPDVLIVDGGKGQLSSVLEALKEVGAEIPVITLAKSKGTSDFKNQKIQRSEERLYIPGRANPYILKKCPSLFRICVQMRDEAHRFSRKLHHKAEHKRVISSWLDEVPGVGEKIRDKILQKLEFSKSELSEFSIIELEGTLSVSTSVATNIYQYLQGPHSSNDESN